MGKTNMDQFAAGLVGTRTPYGVAPNAFDSRCFKLCSDSEKLEMLLAIVLCCYAQTTVIVLFGSHLLISDV